MPVTSTGREVLLAIFKVFAALPAPMVPPEKLRLAGVTVTGATPLPKRSTNASRLLLLPMIVAAPETDPLRDGVKKMFAVQEPPPTMRPLQLSVSEKFPLIAIVMD